MLWFSFYTRKSDKTGNNGKTLSIRHERNAAIQSSQTRPEHDISQFEEADALQTYLFHTERKINNLQLEPRNCGGHLQYSQKSCSKTLPIQRQLSPLTSSHKQEKRECSAINVNKHLKRWAAQSKEYVEKLLT